MPNSVSCNGEIRLSLHLWFETAPPRPIHPNCHTGLPLAPAPLDGFHQDYSSCSMALYMSRVYHPRRMVSTGTVKVLRIDRPFRPRVVVAADAADFKECDPLHYFTSPPSFRGVQVIEAPSLPGLDNFQPSCYHLLKIRSRRLHTVELRFLSIRNISRSALFSVGRLFLQGSLPFSIFWRFV